MNTINSFEGDFSFLSNFFPSPIVDENGTTWDTVEHFFQASKSLDLNEKEFVRGKTTAGRAKRAGRKISIRSDWDDVKITFMQVALLMKFSQNENLKRLLLETGDAVIVEGNNWHDNFWGVCDCSSCDGVGTNFLGRLLMQIREFLNKE